MFVAGVIPVGFSVHLRQQTWEDTTKLTVFLTLICQEALAARTGEAQSSAR